MFNINNLTEISERDMQIWRMYTDNTQSWSVNALKNHFKISRKEVDNAIFNTFKKRQTLIEHIKSNHPESNPNVLEIDNVICASFSHLTVGDVIISNNKIIGIK